MMMMQGPDSKQKANGNLGKNGKETVRVFVVVA